MFICVAFSDDFPPLFRDGPCFYQIIYVFYIKHTYNYYSRVCNFAANLAVRYYTSHLKNCSLFPDQPGARITSVATAIAEIHLFVQFVVLQICACAFVPLFIRKGVSHNNYQERIMRRKGEGKGARTAHAVN